MVALIVCFAVAGAGCLSVDSEIAGMHYFTYSHLPDCLVLRSRVADDIDYACIRMCQSVSAGDVPRNTRHWPEFEAE